MTTIKDALLAIEKDAGRVQTIVDFLGQGHIDFDCERDLAGGPFLALDADRLEGLTARQKATIRQAQRLAGAQNVFIRGSDPVVLHSCMDLENGDVVLHGSAWDESYGHAGPLITRMNPARSSWTWGWYVITPFPSCHHGITRMSRFLPRTCKPACEPRAGLA